MFEVHGTGLKVSEYFSASSAGCRLGEKSSSYSLIIDETGIKAATNQRFEEARNSSQLTNAIEGRSIDQ